MPGLIGQEAAADSLRLAIADVFARPEYRWVEGRRPLEWLGQLWSRLVDWLNALQTARPALFVVLTVVLILALVALLTHVGYVVWRIVRPTARTPAEASGGTRPQGPGAHLERAEALARAGRYGEALAHRFVAALLQLEAARALVYHPAKTPAEYVGEARLDPGGRASLAGLVARLYRHLFGAVPCDDAAYREFGLVAQDVTRHVVPS